MYFYTVRAVSRIGARSEHLHTQTDPPDRVSGDAIVVTGMPIFVIIEPTPWTRGISEFVTTQSYACVAMARPKHVSFRVKDEKAAHPKGRCITQQRRKKHPTIAVPGTPVKQSKLNLKI